MDEPFRDILVNYTPSGKSVDLTFEEIYGTELEFLSLHSEKISIERCDGNQFLNSGCRHVRKKSLRMIRLGRKRAKIKKRLASPLCHIKKTYWNDGEQVRGMKPKKI